MTGLLEVDLSKLETSVTDWKSVVDKLEALATRAERGLQAKADGARWAGVNSDVTREFVRKTAKEFRDAHAEADSIYKVLNDAHAELVAVQRKLKTALEKEAPALGVKVDDYGSQDDGPVIHVFFPHDRTTDDTHTEEELGKAHNLAARIANLVAHAQEIDSSVARALAKSHGGDAHDFGHETYTSLDDAEQQRATELAKLGTRMSDHQFAELNAIMKWNATDPNFSTAFYKSLGSPEKTLEFYGRMALDGTEGDNKERLELTKQLQRNMGTALATATDADNSSHLPPSWGEQFRRLGTKSIELYRGGINPPYGYQILGGLLRYGNYDPRFIDPIAEHIVQLHHKNPDFFMGTKPMAGGADTNWGFNPSGKDGAGYDPLTSVLEGLGHSPEAAKKFFSDDMVPTVYNEDGTVKKGATLDYTYFDELTKSDFEWPPDSLAAPGSDAVAHARDGGPDALGHALEAATLGHSYDDPTPTLKRDDTSAAIMAKVVEAYGDPERIQDPMADSLGRMGAGYIDDLNWALNDNRTDSLYYPTASSGHAQFGESSAIKFLSAVGQHPDGYSEISTAQQVYGTTALEAQVHDGHIDQPHAREIVRTGAQVQGIIDQSRADQVKAEGLAKDEEYNKSLQKNAGWIQFGAGVGIAAGAAFLPPVAAAGVAGTLIPVFTDAGKGAIGQQIANVIGDGAETMQHDSASSIHEQTSEIYRAGQGAAASPMESFMRNHGIHHDDDGFGQNLEEALRTGYGLGTDGASQRGVLPDA
ncbi:DUF6571 family protein [Streptomyces sp. SID161]|uniref:DUF6571 family protein n=1 Tax=Streptomyces sp. SID161 TaxID=2690251 RepID=UPI00136AE74C|nr:DUF6571 family protein [Streptomyces sp. SID161]MYW47993.1 hypothetical protein [Streptomyces sp. SID161]